MIKNFLAQMPPYKTKHERYQEQYPDSIIIVKIRDRAEVMEMNEASGADYKLPDFYPEKGSYNILGSNAVECATILKRTAEYYTNPRNGKNEAFLAIAFDKFEACLEKLCRKSTKQIVVVVQTTVVDMDEILLYKLKDA